MGSIEMILNFGDKGVCTDVGGNLICCFDYRLIDGKCIGCTFGFLFKGGSCVPCETNWHGELCLNKCNCLFHQRCDNVLGCVNKTTYTQPASSRSTTCNTENFTLTTTTNLSEKSEITNPTLTKKSSNENYTQTTSPNLSEESEITNPTPTKRSSDGLLDREIFIYTVVVACIIVILGLNYLVQKYRKKTKKESMANTAQRTHSNPSNSIVDSNLSIYDETMLHENVNVNMLQNEISINTDNASYLYPIQVEDGDKSSSVSTKSVNNSYLSIHESDQNHNSDESDRNDDTKNYLHPFHTVDEDWKEKTHQYDITHVSNKDTDDSSDSSTDMINDGYLNPYQHLNEDWTQKSHCYEAHVTVHHCQLNSTVPSVLDEELKGKENDDNQLMRDKHNIVAYLHSSQSFKKNTFVKPEKRQILISEEPRPDITKSKQPILTISDAGISTYNKQEMVDATLVSGNDGISEISESTRNSLEISKESTNIDYISTYYPSNTHREKALVSVVECYIKDFENNEDNPNKCNILKNVTIHTIASINTDQNTNVHDNNDA